MASTQQAMHPARQLRDPQVQRHRLAGDQAVRPTCRPSPGSRRPSCRNACLESAPWTSTPTSLRTSGEWDRLEQLLAGATRLTGAEADELVDLYQRTATHLSVVRSSAPDPALVGRLSSLVARARSAVTGSAAPRWRDVARFFARRLPGRRVPAPRWWWISARRGVRAWWRSRSAWWVAANPRRPGVASPRPSEIRQLVDHDFATTTPSHPAGAFAFAGLDEQRLGRRAVHRLRRPARPAGDLLLFRTPPTSASSAG